jgi:thymidylate synthase (FAD)
MRIEQPAAVIIYPAGLDGWTAEFKLIEAAGRTAYKSESNMTEDSYKTFIMMLRKRRHFPVLEFGNMVVKVVTDRGISHEIVRHRLLSVVQESTRYCNYSADRFGEEITVVEPGFSSKEAGDVWRGACENAEKSYFDLLKKGEPPQMARSVLPTSLKTELTLKGNFTEWRHIFDQRVLGLTGEPHPDMRRLLTPIYKGLVSLFPFMWGDLD